MDHTKGALPEHQKVIWAFGGGKGGTGKTFVAASLGILLAGKGRDVVLFDGDLGGANLHTALGLRRPGRTLSEFTQGRVQSIEEVIVDTGIENLRLIPGAADSLDRGAPNQVVRSRLAKGLMNVDCDFLLIDLGAGTGYGGVDLFGLADVGTLVVSPEPSAVELAYRFIKTVLYRRLRDMADRPEFNEIVDEAMKGNGSAEMIDVVDSVIRKIGEADPFKASRMQSEIFNPGLQIAVNMVRKPNDHMIGPAICDVVKKYYGPHMEAAGFIPFDERVFMAEREGKPFVIEYESSEVAARFRLALNRLVSASNDAVRNRQLRLI